MVVCGGQALGSRLSCEYLEVDLPGGVGEPLKSIGEAGKLDVKHQIQTQDGNITPFFPHRTSVELLRC